MCQLFVIVLTNAIEANAENGKNSISIHCLENEQQVIIQFSDCGKGILPENQSKIFQPLFTTKSTTNHVGLNLAIAFQIAKIHDGNLFLQKSDSTGSTFVLELNKNLQTNSI